MKIALGQMHIRWEDKAANLGRVENWMKLLKEKNIDLFTLPEMSLTGFSMHTELTKETDKITVAEAEKFARNYQMAVGIGWVKDEGKFCENRYSIVTPEGEILEYTKLHPFSYSGEDRYFQGGTVLPVCEYRGYHLGVQICYDLRFPETFQALSRQADLILVPANWPGRRREHWISLLQARAIENQCYIAGVNCVGDMDGQTYTGDSRLYGPDGMLCSGEILTPADAQPGECAFIYEIDDQVKKVRTQFPVKKDRRDALYRQFYEV
ncbi:carbon-nitrogen family hydrolase [Clostridiaceae bacterium AF31-3BH]|nr:carbon-nitrogen family hydrolase [Clostridiaceae bacterium AF31-3BH]